MKKFLLFIFICILLPNVNYAQDGKALPEVNVEDLKGNKVSTGDFVNKEGPTIVSFWATWCKPCILELNEMQDLYEDWQEETNVKIVAISVDDARSASKVSGFANGKSWGFDIYLDKNSDLKRALNINNVPYTLLLNSTGEIIWQHTGYTPGDEELLYEELLKL